MGKRIKKLLLLFYDKTHDLDRDVSLQIFTLKLIWLVCLLISICLCVFLVIASVVQYRKFEVTTEIRDVYYDSIPFPVITICNSNPMGAPKANQMIRQYYLAKYKVKIATADDFLALLNNGTIQMDNDFIYYTTYNDEKFNKTLREYLAYNSVYVCLMNDVDCNHVRDFERF